MIQECLARKDTGKETLGVTGVPRVSPPQLAAPCWTEPQRSAANEEDASPLACWSPGKQKSVFCWYPNSFILSLLKGKDCFAVSRSVKNCGSSTGNGLRQNLCGLAPASGASKSWGETDHSPPVHMVPATFLNSVSSFSRHQQLLGARQRSGAGIPCASIGFGFTPRSAAAQETLQNSALGIPIITSTPVQRHSCATPPGTRAEESCSSPSPGQQQASASSALWALNSPHLLGLPWF